MQVFHRVEQSLHIIWKLRRKAHLLTGDRMRKFQLPGMKRLPADPGEIRTVEKVTGQGMTDVLHVHTDLVGATGFQPQLYQ